METFNVATMSKEEKTYVMAVVERRAAIGAGLGAGIGTAVSVYFGLKAMAAAAVVLASAGIGAGVVTAVDKIQKRRSKPVVE
jgi:predicted MFS family arabinose efflux permease